MSIAPPSNPPAGWYANPEGLGQRYWDGAAWTQHMNATPPPPQVAAPTAAVVQPTNGIALAALITGIAGALIGGAMNILFFMGLALGATAFILGAIGRRREYRRKMATWGMLLGVLAFGFGIYGGVQVNKAANELSDAGQSLSNYGACVDNAQTLAQMNRC